MINLKLFSIALLSAALSSTAVYADPESDVDKAAAIRGRVIDADRHTLPGASIYIKELKTGVISDIDGFYTLPDLKPGLYHILVTYVGYQPYEMTVEVLETFKISKVGTIAGCIVREGKITRTAKVRVIRDGIVIYTGALGSLKRFKDDVKEVAKGFECGLNIENYNDVRVGDIIEAYQEVEVKKTL